MLVFKDGNAQGSVGRSYVAYLIAQGNPASGTYETMFLETNLDQKDISHVSLYGSPSVVPIPGAVWLFASALLGLAAVRRRAKSGHATT